MSTTQHPAACQTSNTPPKQITQNAPAGTTGSAQDTASTFIVQLTLDPKMLPPLRKFLHECADMISAAWNTRDEDLLLVRYYLAMIVGLTLNSAGLLEDLNVFDKIPVEVASAAAAYSQEVQSARRTSVPQEEVPREDVREPPREGFRERPGALRTARQQGIYDVIRGMGVESGPPQRTAFGRKME